MAKSVLVELELPEDLARLTLPASLNQRLQALLDKQDREGTLPEPERQEAGSLVNLAELLSLLNLRATGSATPFLRCFVKEEPMPNPTLTMAEIAEQYPDEWDLLANSVNAGFRVQRGELIYHSKRKDNVYKKLFTLKLKSPGIFWTGSIPTRTPGKAVP